MDIKRAFTYPFEDPAWKEKLGIGSLVMMVPILSFATLGFTTQLMRNEADDHPHPMPQWADLGRLFQVGVMLGLAMLVYAIPVMLLMLAMGCVVVVAIASGMAGAEPLWVVVVTLVILACGVGLISLYNIALGLLRPAIHIQYARTLRFGSCFAIGELIAVIRSHPGDYLTVWGAMLAVRWAWGFVLSMVLGVVYGIPMIGPMIGMAMIAIGAFYIAVIAAKLEGRLFALTRSATAP